MGQERKRIVRKGQRAAWYSVDTEEVRKHVSMEKKKLFSCAIENEFWKLTIFFTLLLLIRSKLSILPFGAVLSAVTVKKHLDFCTDPHSCPICTTRQILGHFIYGFHFSRISIPPFGTCFARIAYDVNGMQPLAITELTE